jgi:hypothetical protein
VAPGSRLNLGLQQPSLLQVDRNLSQPLELGDSRVQYPEGFPVYTPHRYLLELISKEQVEDSITLYYVSSIQMSQPHALDRKWTLGTVYEQSTAFRERTFSISGRTGDQPLDIERFLKMRNFLEAYADKKKKTENAYVNNRVYRLRLRATWECEYFEASVLSFSYQRQVGDTTNSYIWNLVLATNQYVEKKELPTLEAEAAKRAAEKAAQNAVDVATEEVPPLSSDELKSKTLTPEVLAKAKEQGLTPDQYLKQLRLDKNQAGPESNDDFVTRTRASVRRDNLVTPPRSARLLSRAPGAPDLLTVGVSSAVATVTGSSAAPPSSWFDDVTASFGLLETKAAETTAYLVSLSLKPAAIYRKTVTPAISMLSTVANSAASIVGAVNGSLPAVRQAVINTAESAKQSFDTFKSAWAGLEELTTEEYWSNLVAPIWPNRRRESSVLVDAIYQPVIAQPTPSGNSGGGGTGVQDAYNLAWIFLGDRGRWREIMEVNSMLDPYTRADGSQVKAGDLILIPDPDGVPARFTSNSFYGSDFKVKDGDLVMRGSSGFQTVSGEENLRQSLSHRFRTVRGTNRAFPGFGLDKFLNEKQLSSLVAQVWSSSLAQVTADRRVGTVVRLIIDEQPSVYKIGLSFKSATQSNLTFSFEYTPE